MDNKVCFMCRESKNLSDFSRDASRKDGHAARCKPCDVKVHTKYYFKYKDLEWYKKKQINSARRSALKNPDKAIARYKVKNAIRDGVLEKPNICALCSNSNTKLNAHHKDYSKPLEVIWLCIPCHRKIHNG